MGIKKLKKLTLDLRHDVGDEVKVTLSVKTKSN